MALLLHFLIHAGTKMVKRLLRSEVFNLLFKKDTHSVPCRCTKKVFEASWSIMSNEQNHQVSQPVRASCPTSSNSCILHHFGCNVLVGSPSPRRHYKLGSSPTVQKFKRVQQISKVYYKCTLPVHGKLASILHYAKYLLRSYWTVKSPNPKLQKPGL